MKELVHWKATQLGLIACLTLCLATGASAFDGNRKGFILGGGLGLGLTSFTQTLEYTIMDTSTTSDRENKFAVMTDFKIGFGATEQVLVYYTNKVSWFSIENVYKDNVTIANGLGGVGVAYYFKPTGPSPYISGGLGLSTWMLPFESDADTWTGFGLVVGGGYEFSPHYSIEGNLVWGEPGKEEGGLKASSNALSLTVTIKALAY